MATIRKQVTLPISPEAAWDALADFHHVHERVVPGVVVASKPDGKGVRIVTFANGLTVREELISADPEARRLAYTASGGALRHHNGVFKVRSHEQGCRVVWFIDFLPDAAAPAIDQLMEAGCAAMRRTLG